MLDISNWVQSQIQYFMTPMGAFLFILIYIFWVAFLLPGSWLSMVAGLIYGSLLGSLIVFIGASFGASLTFWSGRTFLRNFTQRLLNKSPKLAYIEKKVSDQGLKLILLSRLSPVFPFSFLNLIYGVSQVSFKAFFIGLIGILPGTILYCSFGSLAGELTKFNQILLNRNNFQSFSFSLIGILATIGIVILIFYSIRDALQEFESSF